MLQTARRLLLITLPGSISDCSSIVLAEATFVDDRFEDFAAGSLDDGGNNLYVARDGTLRTINRFDLNDDGHLDLLFNCTHNTHQMLPATAGAIGSKQSLTAGKWTDLKTNVFAVDATHRYLQYRATLLSDNGDRYPVLDKIEISLN
jgi:hypothetical protein